MTAYAADAPTSAGTTVTQKSGTAAADTLPAGSVVLFQNTGAGSHNIDLTINYTYDGLSPGSAATPGKRRITIAAGAYSLNRIPAGYGDANGQVAVAIDGTASEVKFWVIGA